MTQSVNDIFHACKLLLLSLSACLSQNVTAFLDLSILILSKLAKFFIDFLTSNDIQDLFLGQLGFELGENTAHVLNAKLAQDFSEVQKVLIVLSGVSGCQQRLGGHLGEVKDIVLSEFGSCALLSQPKFILT